MLDCEAVRRKDQAGGRLTRKRGQRGIDFPGIADMRCNDINPELPAGGFRFSLN
jgi:hypothetical protein